MTDGPVALRGGVGRPTPRLHGRFAQRRRVVVFVAAFWRGLACGLLAGRFGAGCGTSHGLALIHVGVGERVLARVQWVEGSGTPSVLATGPSNPVPEPCWKPAIVGG